ncbi:hypothetical protein COU80_01760 [Candidatus Peregrinibacteria bacterium CG10_big_fil_rev_8_21_14_0_10_55_24]|nr:MAG: hypothetical protein COU80_01760 [Candidatus Peregrinibacteria bacterium CG10_big_fil_rev_8_21_14_0_10_55_24]
MKLLHEGLFQTGVGALGSALGTGLVAILLVTIFKVPSFGLDLDFIPVKITSQGTSLPVLDISIINKKWWLGFQSNEVLFGLFLPEDFVENKEFSLLTGDGLTKWERDWRGANRIDIDGEKYVLSRQIISLPVYPDSVTHFLRVTGDFFHDQNIRIYYYFETPLGKYPWNLRQGQRVESAQNHKLPFSEVTIK